MSDPSWTEATNPFALFDAWFSDAAATEPDVPNAMQLATVGPAGQPTLRTVLLKGITSEGLSFYTNLDSRKARDLAANSKAAALFHWKTAKRQIQARGPVVRLGEADADKYWSTRPRGSQIASWASVQSRPLPSREAYDGAVAEISVRFDGADVPRPPFWSGYRLEPEAFEFWEDGEYRMHTRLEFTRDRCAWSKTLLYP